MAESNPDDDPVGWIAFINKRKPFLFFNMRLALLGISLALFPVWIAFGYESSLGSVVQALIPINWGESMYGVGVHVSTAQAALFLGYVLMLNMQLGGFSSFRQFTYFLKKDIHSILYGISHGTVMLQRKEADLKEPRIIDGARSLLFAFFTVVSAIFIFENVWVPLYDWFNFNSVLWPVYQGYINMGLNSYFYRNVLMGIGLPILAFLVVYTAAGRFHLKLRLDRWAAVLSLAAVSCWLFWIFYPFPFQAVHGTMFPQTAYTFYGNRTVGQVYGLADQSGKWFPNDGIHTVNLLTKYAMFALVGYVFCIKVKRESGVKV